MIESVRRFHPILFVITYWWADALDKQLYVEGWRPSRTEILK